MFVWKPLILAAVLAAISIPFLLHKHWVRPFGLVGAVAIALAITGIEPVMTFLGHPIGPGPIMLVILAVWAFSAVMVVLDHRPKNGYKKPLFPHKKKPGQSSGQVAIAGSSSRSSSGGSKPHHLRPLAAWTGFAVGGILLWMNLDQVMGTMTGGWGQAATQIATRGKAG